MGQRPYRIVRTPRQAHDIAPCCRVARARHPPALSAASAIEAAVLGARPTRASDLLSESCPCAEHANAGVACGDACLHRVVLDGGAVDVDPLQCLRIFRLQRLGERGDAATDDRVELRFVRLHGAHLHSKGLDPPALRISAAGVVRDRVAQDAVEPSDRGLVDLAHVLEASDQGVLKDFFGQGAVINATFDEREEFAVTRDQRRERVGSDWREGLRLDHGRSEPRISERGECNAGPLAASWVRGPNHPPQETMTKTFLNVAGMSCASCAERVRHALAIDGVTNVDARVDQGAVTVDHETRVDSGHLIGALRQAGYEGSLASRDPASHV